MTSWKATKTHHMYTNSCPLQLIWLAAMNNQSHYPLKVMVADFSSLK
jgi:hypothetical protein